MCPHLRIFFFVFLATLHIATMPSTYVHSQSSLFKTPFTNFEKPGPGGFGWILVPDEDDPTKKDCIYFQDGLKTLKTCTFVCPLGLQFSKHSPQCLGQKRYCCEKYKKS